MKKLNILLLVIIVAVLFSSCDINSIGEINYGLPSALQSGNLERVKEAVENGADVNKASLLLGPDASPLYYSMREGQRFIPEYLLSKGANPNFIDSDGISLLMFTVGAQKEHGLNYGNVTDNENYKTLLNDKRININLTGELGFTALDYACRDKGNLSTVNYLIGHGAKITAKTMKCAIEGFSNGFCEASVVKIVFDSLTQQGIPYGIEPEFVAAIQGETDNLRSLVNSNKIKETDKQAIIFLSAAFGDAKTLQIFSNKEVDLDENGTRLMGISCSYGKLETFKFLVSKHVNFEIPISQPDAVWDETALTKAIRHNRIEIVDYLLKCGAKFQTFDNTTRENALEIACGNGNLELVKFVIDHGYPLTDDQLIRAMTAAALEDNINILEYFLFDKKANINFESKSDSETVLGSATSGASLDTIKYLVSHGADVSITKQKTLSPLDPAVSYNRLDIAKYLIDKGADVNAIGVYSDGGKKDSLLTQAVQNGYFDMIKLLIENGAIINNKEEEFEDNKTLLDLAKQEGSKHIIDYLEKAQKRQIVHNSQNSKK